MKIKEIILSILAFVFFVMFLLSKCSNGKYQQPKNDTIIKIDTVIITAAGKVSYIPKPYKVEIPGKDSILIVIDTPKNLLEFREGYFRLLKQSLAKSYYSDSISVSENGLIGYIYSNDTIQKNSIIGKGIGYKLHYPKIKQTTTIIEKEKKKTLWFVGGEILGNQTKYINGIEVNMGFLNKKNQFYEIGYQKWGTDNIYKLGFKIKL